MCYNFVDNNMSHKLVDNDVSYKFVDNVNLSLWTTWIWVCGQQLYYEFVENYRSLSLWTRMWVWVFGQQREFEFLDNDVNYELVDNKVNYEYVDNGMNYEFEDNNLSLSLMTWVWVMPRNVSRQL